MQLLPRGLRDPVPSRGPREIEQDGQGRHQLLQDDAIHEHGHPEQHSCEVGSLRTILLQGQEPEAGAPRDDRRIWGANQEEADQPQDRRLFLRRDGGSKAN